VEAVELPAADWSVVDDFYTAYFADVGAPEWHRRNLDAVWDSLTGGGINNRNPPFRICISGTARMPCDAREILSRFDAVVQEAE
jgi:hypothetical protein